MVTSNPYHFGSPAIDPYFCDRESEVGDLEALLRAHIHVFVLGPRRYGKTSIVKRALRGFEAGGGRAGYAELIRCTTELDVATEVLAAVVNGVLSGRHRAKGWLEDILRRLRVHPTVGIGVDGRVSLSFEPQLASRSWQEILDDAVMLVQDAAREGPVALALDEVQQVATIGPKGMGGTLKHLADQLSSGSLLLSGSHQSTMDALTRGRGAPLYGMGERMAIEPIPIEAMVPYLQRRARAGGKRLDKATAAELYVRGGAVPNYVQQLAFAAFEEADAAIDSAALDAGLSAIVARQSSDFAERFEGLADSQKRTLLALANEPTGRVFTKVFMGQVQVANANAVRKALDVLTRRELVDRRAGVYEVVSPFLAEWLRGHG
jgi:hypothetical protein